MSGKPNEFEILDFVTNRFKGLLGMAPKQRKIPVLVEEVAKDERRKSVVPQAMQELPGKVDTFIDHINQFYFDGQLDVGSKDMLKKGMRHGDDEGQGQRRRIAFSE